MPLIRRCLLAGSLTSSKSIRIYVEPVGQEDTNYVFYIQLFESKRRQREIPTYEHFLLISVGTAPWIIDFETFLPAALCSAFDYSLQVGAVPTCSCLWFLGCLKLVIASLVRLFAIVLLLTPRVSFHHILFVALCRGVRTAVYINIPIFQSYTQCKLKCSNFAQTILFPCKGHRRRSRAIAAAAWKVLGKSLTSCESAYTRRSNTKPETWRTFWIEILLHALWPTAELTVSGTISITYIPSIDSALRRSLSQRQLLYCLKNEELLHLGDMQKQNGTARWGSTKTESHYRHIDSQQRQ